jgi:hypothetical protein
MAKKILRTEPINRIMAPGHERVYYTDGTVGQRFVGKSSNEAAPPRMDAAVRAREWDDSMDGAPASPDEIEQMMLQIKNAGYSEPRPDMKQIMEKAYEANPKYREYVDDMNKYDQFSGEMAQNPEQDDAAFNEVRDKHPEFVRPIDEDKNEISGYLILPKKKGS